MTVDSKTLELEGARVDKARALTTKIDAAQQFLDLLTRNEVDRESGNHNPFLVVREYYSRGNTLHQPSCHDEVFPPAVVREFAIECYRTALESWRAKLAAI